MSSPHLFAIGLSHKTARVEQREKAVLGDSEARGMLRGLAADPRVEEAVALSTCNRTEVYAAAHDAGSAERALTGALLEHSQIGALELSCARYTLRGDRAAGQLFLVASGLDSMVLGESEIQGQVRSAWEVAAEEGAAGSLLNHLFQQALRVGKRVRTDTRVGEGPTSVSAVAVDLAFRTAGKGASVVVIGAGKMAAAAANALVDRGVAGVVVLNRTAGTARELAEQLGVRGAGLEGLPEELTQADVVISATDAPHAILERRHLERVLDRRAGRPLTMIDISVPRDLDHDIAGLEGVALYDIDDLEREVEESFNGRLAEAERGRAIVEEEVRGFRHWRAGLAAAPTIRILRERAEEIRLAELERADAQWESLSAADRERIEAITRAIVNKLLHEPTVRATEAARNGEGLAQLETLRHLFDLSATDQP